MANAIHEVYGFSPLHAASANPIPVLFFSLRFPDRWHTKWKSLIWWFFRVHVHFTVVFLLITTAEEEKTQRCPGGWDVGSCNRWELNIKWRQAFHVCSRHITCVSLSMMLALIWHFKGLNVITALVPPSLTMKLSYTLATKCTCSILGSPKCWLMVLVSFLGYFSVYCSLCVHCRMEKRC